MNEGDHRKLRGALVAGLVFLGAWKAVYWQGLLYLVLALVGVTLSHVFVPAGSTITADRAREVQAGRDRDRRLLGAYFLVNIVTFLVAGMDSGRFRWTPDVPVGARFPIGHELVLGVRAGRYRRCLAGGPDCSRRPLSGRRTARLCGLHQHDAQQAGAWSALKAARSERHFSSGR